MRINTGNERVITVGAGHEGMCLGRKKTGDGISLSCGRGTYRGVLAVSAHPHGDCVVREGRYAGWKLSELYASHRELFGGITAEKFPLLIKIIDAKEI